MTANNTTDKPPDDELVEAALGLLSLAASLLLLALTIAAMRATDRGSTTIPKALVMLIVSGAPFCLSLSRLLGFVDELEDADDESLDLASSFLDICARFIHIPITVYVGGCILPGCPVLGWVLGGVVGLFLSCILSPPTALLPDVLRGTTMMPLSQVRLRASQITESREMALNWAGVKIPERHSEQHFELIGATGSGKTVALRMLMQSVLSEIRPGSDHRALIYDAKQDMLEILSGMSLSCPIRILNPLDARSVALSLADMITTPTAALQFASIIIEEERGQNSFFTKAARDLFGAVMVALHHIRPYEWTFADMLSILSSTDRTRSVLEQVPHTRDIAREHFERDDPRTVANVQYTISANIAYLRPIAALWHHTVDQFNLTQWLNEESILVLGNADDLRCPIDAVNRAFFQRIVELVLSQSESNTRRTWFILDELKEMGRLDALPRLLTKGRSKGVRAVLAFQTIEGLRHVYGDRLAGEISGMPANKCFLRTDSEETAAWASRVIGEAEYRQWTQTVNSGGNTSSAEQIVKKEAVLASELLRLPLANRERFWSYCITPCIGVYKGVTHFASQLCPKGTTANFLPRPDSDQYLPPELFNESVEEPSLDDIGRLRYRPEADRTDEFENLL